MSSGHLVQTADLRMHYLQRGTGEPVVLIHGFPETSYSWRHQLAALSEHYAVFAPDTRGFGQTDKPGIRVTRQILAQDVINFMDAFMIPVASRARRFFARNRACLRRRTHPVPPTAQGTGHCQWAVRNDQRARPD